MSGGSSKRRDNCLAPSRTVARVSHIPCCYTRGERCRGVARHPAHILPEAYDRPARYPQQGAVRRVPLHRVAGTEEIPTRARLAVSAPTRCTGISGWNPPPRVARVFLEAHYHFLRSRRGNPGQNLFDKKTQGSRAYFTPAKNAPAARAAITTAKVTWATPELSSPERMPMPITGRELPA